MTKLNDTVLFLSLLKPCDDVRIVSRLGPAIKKALPDTSVVSVGPYGNHEFKSNKIQCLGLFPYDRRGFYRLKHLLILAKIILKVKPKIYIINTTDLLIVTTAYKILFGGKFVYDIQENFALNARYGTHHSTAKGILKSWVVSFLERLSSRYVDRFWLAEKVYVAQLPFLKNKYKCLQNFPLRLDQNDNTYPKDRTYTATITGTLSVAFGIYKSLEWLKILRNNHPDARFKMIGHCPDATLYKDLLVLTARLPWLEIDISLTPLSHVEIIAAIKDSIYLLCPYEERLEISGKVPSKILEALALKTTVLTTQSMAQKFNSNPFEAIPEAFSINEMPLEIMEGIKHWDLDIASEMGILGLPK